MDFVIASFVIFYLFVFSIEFFSNKKKMWSELRETYSCSKEEVKSIESLGESGRIFYAIDGDWANTNIISMCRANEHLYMWGSEFSLGWIFQPVKIPLSDMTFVKTKLCFFKTRDVYELKLCSTLLQYAIPRKH